MSNQFIAITINNLELTKKYKSIDSVYKMLKKYGEVYIISVERNEVNENIHYHILIKSDIIIVNNIDNIWYKEIDTDIELLKYINYIKKDGNFKTYKVTEVENVENNHWTIKALALVIKYEKPGDLFSNNPEMIKYINHILNLYKVIERK